MARAYFEAFLATFRPALIYSEHNDQTLTENTFRQFGTYRTSLILRRISLLVQLCSTFQEPKLRLIDSPALDLFKYHYVYVK